MIKARKVLQENYTDLIARRNVVAVGVSVKVVNGIPTEDICITCFVKEKVSKDKLYKTDILPNKIDDVLLDVVEVGEIVAQGRKSKNRPAPGGVSLGHPQVTAGTLGMWLHKNGKPVILSNNHVIANSNNASIGDNIYQPGDADGGSFSDTIAKLLQFKPIDWNGNNLIDAAIAEVDETAGGGSSCFIANFFASILNFFSNIFQRNTQLVPMLKQDVSDIVDYSIYEYALSPSTVVEPSLNMRIKKSGRTTGITTGTIIAIDAVVDVGYGNGKVARFVDQILTTNISAGGDSGSVVTTENEQGLVGLLFAGSTQVTVLNKISHVLDEFGLTIP